MYQSKLIMKIPAFYFLLFLVLFSACKTPQDATTSSPSQTQVTQAPVIQEKELTEEEMQKLLQMEAPPDIRTLSPGEQNEIDPFAIRKAELVCKKQRIPMNEDGQPENPEEFNLIEDELRDIDYRLQKILQDEAKKNYFESKYQQQLNECK